MADAFALGGVGCAVDFVDGVGHMIAEGGLIEGEGGVRLGACGDCEREAEECEGDFHLLPQGR